MRETITLPILTVGKETASNGVKVNFDEEILSQVVNSYDPTKFKAPLIISHKTHGVKDNNLVNSEFAYGFPSRLRKNGNVVEAVFDSLNPQVTEWYRDGNLLSLSPSFYTPSSPHNPTPGQWHLRHIAMLGATPPAIKTLPPVNLEEGDEGVITLEYSEDSLNFMCSECEQELSTDYLTRIREWIIEDKGKEKADAIIPLTIIEALRTKQKHEGMEQREMEKTIANLENKILNLQLQLESLPTTTKQIYQPVNYGESNMDLKALMSESGMTISDVADSTGIDEELLKQYVSGKKKPTKSHQTLLVDLLGETDEEDTDIEKKPKGKMDYSEIDRLYRKNDRIEDELDETKDRVADFEEQITALQEQIINLSAEKVASERRARAIENQFLDYQEQQRRKEIADFVAHLERETVLSPAQSGVRVINFGEGEEAEYDLVSFLESLDEERYNFMQCFLSDLPPQVDFGEYTAPEESVNASPKGKGHYTNHQTDPERMATVVAIKALAEEKNLSFSEASNLYFQSL